jgi:hypothetical protein
LIRCKKLVPADLLAEVSWYRELLCHVAVGIRRWLAYNRGEAVDVTVLVSIGVTVNISIPVPIAVAIGICVGVAIGICVGVAIGICVSVAISIGISISITGRWVVVTSI